MRIVCACQGDFNAIPDGFCGEIEIRFGKLGSPAVVDWRFDSAVIEAHDNAKIKAYDNAKINAYDDAAIDAHNNAVIMAYDNAVIDACDDVVIEAYDNTKIKAYDDVVVNSYGVTKVIAYDEETLTYFNHKGTQYRLGDDVLVSLIDVNMMERQMNYTIIKKIEERSK